MSSPRRIYLHIGLPKTGTTFMQEVLWRNRTNTAAQGLLYPGRDPAAHHRAAVDLLPDRYQGWIEPHTAGAWHWLCEQTSVWSGDVVISSELLAIASPAQAAEALTALTFAEVHIVCTARDLVRQIPSVWQEDVKNKRTTGFTEFVGQVRDGRQAESAEIFWSYQDLPQVLRTWGAGLPPERVHVVTVPPRGSATDLLWQRCTSVLGIDPTGFDMTETSRNSSLDLVQTELLRRLNTELGDSIAWPEYIRVVKGELADEILPALSRRTAIVLPSDAREWATEVAERFAAGIGSAGYDVVGDLADLIPAATGSAPGPQETTDSEIADIAVRAIAELMRRHTRPAEELVVGGVRRRLVDLSEQHRQLMAMRRAYWRTRARLHNATRRR
ncbi:MAG TPA: hypothetical protein VFX16_19515 [Pseudonocardiaceae bacterium]|nr:hypothetical protein [Pseudonocardiaceae bacterium]